MNSSNAYQHTSVIAPVKQSPKSSLKVVPANYLETWSAKNNYTLVQQATQKQNSQQKNIVLSVVYAVIIALWFMAGSALASYFQVESALLFWTGWTLVFGWSAGLLFFSAVSAFQLRTK